MGQDMFLCIAMNTLQASPQPPPLFFLVSVLLKFNEGYVRFSQHWNRFPCPVLNQHSVYCHRLSIADFAVYIVLYKRELLWFLLSQGTDLFNKTLHFIPFMYNFHGWSKPKYLLSDSFSGLKEIGYPNFNGSLFFYWKLRLFGSKL